MPIGYEGMRKEQAFRMLKIFTPQGCNGTVPPFAGQQQSKMQFLERDTEKSLHSLTVSSERRKPRGIGALWPYDRRRGFEAERLDPSLVAESVDDWTLLYRHNELFSLEELEAMISGS